MFNRTIVKVQVEEGARSAPLSSHLTTLALEVLVATSGVGQYDSVHPTDAQVIVQMLGRGQDDTAHHESQEHWNNPRLGPK